MDITGARWRLDWSEAVLRIRALRASGDFDDYWDFHKQQELQRNHISKFHDPERLFAATVTDSFCNSVISYKRSPALIICSKMVFIII
jgi:hypothetical protein